MIPEAALEPAVLLAVVAAFVIGVVVGWWLSE